MTTGKKLMSMIGNTEQPQYHSTMLDSAIRIIEFCPDRPHIRSQCVAHHLRQPVGRDDLQIVVQESQQLSLRQFRRQVVDGRIVELAGIIDDADAGIRDISATVWRVINSVEWRRDLVLPDKGYASAEYPFSGGRLGIDATRKMPGEGLTGDWPEELCMAESVKQLVDGRWREYGFE